MTILQSMTPEQELAYLRAENERLRKNKATTNGIKVSPKGCVAVYGLGRFPVVLYASQWQALLDRADEVREFIEANRGRLAWKDTDQD